MIRDRHAARAAFAVFAGAFTLSIVITGGRLSALDGAEWQSPAGLKMVEVKGGTYKMGSPASELKYGRSGDELQHEATVSDFAISATEVTNEQFRQFQPEHDSGSFRGQDLNGAKQPAVMVSWEDARAFCKWLGEQDSSHTYRLPKEVEWEYACRGGEKGAKNEDETDAFFWGSGLAVERAASKYCNANDATALQTFKWRIPAFNRDKSDDKVAATAAVGSFDPNPLGLHDLAGNVWEWCEDVYGLYPVPDALGGEPVRPEPSDGSLHVIRGGAFDSPPKFCRSAARNAAHFGMRAPNIGFRVVAVVPSAPSEAPADDDGTE